MKSPDFDPKNEVSEVFLQELFPVIPMAEEAEVQNGFHNAILQVNAAGKVQAKNSSQVWSLEKDKILIQNEVSYQLDADGVWKDDQGSAWHGQEMALEINLSGRYAREVFYVLFEDWNKKNREGLGKF